jgi:hypothetical protein
MIMTSFFRLCFSSGDLDNIRDATELLSDMVNALNPADRMVNGTFKRKLHG